MIQHNLYWPKQRPFQLLQDGSHFEIQGGHQMSNFFGERVVFFSISMLSPKEFLALSFANGF